MGTAETILRLLDLFQQGMMTTARIAAVRARINEMKESGRDPSGEEWSSLFDSLFQDGDRLRRAAGGGSDTGKA